MVTNKKSSDIKFLPVSGNFFLSQEMLFYTLIFLPVTSNFVLSQENSSCDIIFFPGTENFFLWQELIFVSPSSTNLFLY